MGFSVSNLNLPEAPRPWEKPYGKPERIVSALDIMLEGPIGAAAFDSLIRNLQQSLDLTVVMNTHDLDSIYAICDRVAVLVENHVIVGTLETLLRHAHPWIREYFHGPRGRAAARAACAVASDVDEHARQVDGPSRASGR